MESEAVQFLLESNEEATKRAIKRLQKELFETQNYESLKKLSCIYQKSEGENPFDSFNLNQLEELQ
jgi:hypothetical protein